MSRSAPQIENEIRVALQGASLAARGAWLGLVDLFAASPRSGQLRKLDGVPLTTPEIAHELYVGVDLATQALESLQAVGLLDRLGDAWISKPLQQLETKRAGQRRRKRWERSGRA